MNTKWHAVVVIVAYCLVVVARADAPDPDPARFAAEIESFAVWDTKNSFADGATLFVGSSSIRLWPTAKAFPEVAVINRGFGGSEISDVIHFYDQVIKPYAAPRIFLYAGDNDIARGKTAERVAGDQSGHRDGLVVVAAD